MYNLNVEEISMVDGGGDGAGKLIWAAGKWVAQGIAWDALTRNSSYGNGSNRTGSNQTYGRNGLDTGGCMMQAGGCRGR